MQRAIQHRMWFLLPLLSALMLASLSTFPGTGTSPSRSGEEPGIPATVGWHQIPHTQLAPHCPSDPSIQGATGCRAVIGEWNGGIADTKRQRLIIWGGGHNDYYGNEVYAFDLKNLSMSRLTDPSPVTNVNDCPEAYPDGRPSSRHTYGGLVYVPNQDALYAFGGGKASCGSLSTAIWKLDLSTLQWISMEPHRGDPLYYAPGITSDFDPNTGMVFLSDREHFFRYDPASNTLTRLTALPDVDYHLTGVIDPDRRLFMMMGWPGQFWVIEIGPRSRHAVRDWSGRVKGCDKLLHAAFPGLVYDPVQRLVVGWPGGDSVILFDPDRMSCTEQTYRDGPGAAQEHGTSGRFRYFPSLGVFAVVNDWKQDAFLLRLSPPGRASP